MALNSAQQAAAHRLAQDVCVVAGPGSGKTRVLIERFRWLVMERRVPAGKILAITFTERAAIEIKQRLVKAFENHPALREEVERAQASTIHAFCARLLRENAIAAGMDPEFQVLEFSAKLLRESSDEVLELAYQAHPNRVRRLLRSLAVDTFRDGPVPDLAQCLIDSYEALRLSGGDIQPLRDDAATAQCEQTWRDLLLGIANDDTPCTTPNQREQYPRVRDWVLECLSLPPTVSERHFELTTDTYNATHTPRRSRAFEDKKRLADVQKELRCHWAAQFYTAERQLLSDAILELDRVYRAKKRALSVLDFDDLEEQAIRLLEGNSELRRQTQDQFAYILMDELQDTNPLQWRFVELLRSSDRFFAVGDVNQSIFGFRHATPGLFKDYRERLENQGLSIDELRENYRSHPDLITFVNRLFASSVAGVEEHTLLPAGSFPDASTTAVDVFAVRAATGPEAELREARHIAYRIASMVERKEARFGDIAILTRANAATADLQSALDEYGVPSVVLGGTTLFETREVRDAVLLLRVLANPRDEIALAGLLRSPVFGISDEELYRRVEHASLAESVAQSPPPHWDTIPALRNIRHQVSPDLLVRRAFDECGYEAALSERARANIEKFLAALRKRYNNGRPPALSDLITDLSAAQPEAEAPPADFSDAVRLMTLHKSKGLEFPVVFLPFLHRASGGGSPVVNCSPAHGLGVKWRDPATRDPLADAAHQRNEKARRDAEAGEENRLLYVGLTRAMHRLVLSWSQTGESITGQARVLAAAEFLPEAVAVDPPVPSAAQIERAATELPELAPQEIGDAWESAITVTDVSRFVECPRKYYLSRYLRMAPMQQLAVPLEEDDTQEIADAEDLTAAELGNQVHAILAGQPPDAPSRDAVELADRFTTSDLGKAAVRAPRQEREWEFVFEAAGQVLRGVIDLWFERGRELVLVDYKTDQVAMPVPRERIRGYELQLQIYAEAIRRSAGRNPDRAVLAFLRTGEEVDVDLSPLALGAGMEQVHRFRNAQQTLAFPINPGEQCYRCPHFKGACPAEPKGMRATPSSAGD